MQELRRKDAILRAEAQYDEAHADSFDDDMEEGEMEMESGEDMMDYGMESGEFMEEGESEVEYEGDSNLVSPSENSAGAPELIPLRLSAKEKSKLKLKGSKARSQSEVKVSKANPKDFESESGEDEEKESKESSEEIDYSQEIADLEGSGNENEHGFMYAHNLDTYRLSRTERLAKQEKEYDHDAHREQFKSKRREKKGGETNTQKLKNKPFNMLLPKKVKMHHEKRDAQKGIKVFDNQQRGHFKKHQAQKIDSKKRKLVKTKF